MSIPEMSTLDVMEEIAYQVRTHSEITATLLETWENDLIVTKTHFADIFLKMTL